jgi:mono/diheme cytochrome c family protein
MIARPCLRAALAPIAAAAVGLVGCQSLEERAPLIPPTAGNSMALSQGRAIYVSKGQCSRCHAAREVKKFTPAQWDAILPVMSQQTPLTPAEQKLVHDYVRAIHSGIGFVPAG